MDDNSIMTFGKYKGKALANIPEDYFLWLYEKHDAPLNEGRLHLNSELKKYIEDNFKVKVKK